MYGGHHKGRTDLGRWLFREYLAVLTDNELAGLAAWQAERRREPSERGDAILRSHEIEREQARRAQKTAQDALRSFEGPGDPVLRRESRAQGRGQAGRSAGHSKVSGHSH